MPVERLVSESAVSDEPRGREVARTRLADAAFVGHHPGNDEVWIVGPPSEELAYFLRDVCGYSELQIEATLSSYFDGF